MERKDDADGLQRAADRAVNRWSDPLPSVTDRGTASSEFLPAALLGSAHHQTILGSVLGGRAALNGTRQRRLRLADGDQLVLCDNTPLSWNKGCPVVLLLHGLAGSSESGYMLRLAAKLNDRGVRVLRLNHRGCGAGAELADRPFHAGRTEDVAAAVELAVSLCPDSPLAVVGFSVSGNTLLRYLGENPAGVAAAVRQGIAVCPPVDLLASVRCLQKTAGGRFYDRYFCRKLRRQIIGTRLWKEHLPLVQSVRNPQGLLEFDDLFTAPASGFSSAEDYYSKASACTVIHQISVPVQILAAADDPVVNPEPLLEASRPQHVQLTVTSAGGHLGYIGRSGVDPDRRWMDWRIVDWLLAGF